MNPQTVNSSLGVVSLVGGMGLFLPSLDTAWGAHPSDHEAATRVRRGEATYLGMALVLGGLAAYGQGSAVPLVLSLGLAVVVVAMYEQALAHVPPAKASA